MTLTVRRYHSRGFALPTVLITSLAMMIVLLVALTASSSVTASLREQYYSMAVNEAAEAGLSYAQACLSSNSTGTWANNLAPNTDCNGTVVSGQSEFIIDKSDIKTTFSVPPPTGTGAKRLTATGTFKLFRQSQASGASVRSQSTSLNKVVGRPIDTTNILIGATSPFNGSVNMHYGIILPTGKAQMAGYNGDGRLGIGNTSTIYVPQEFKLPAGELAAKGYSSLGAGQQTFIVTQSGNVYAAGNNTKGALGIGTVGGNISMPQKVLNIPNGVKIKFITTTQTFGNTDTTSFLMGDDNNIYSTGSCAYGVLGNGAAISGCSNTGVLQRVALPTPTSDPNTIPVTDVRGGNIDGVSVGNSSFVVMKGGAVYGWGRNIAGELGTGNTTPTSTPVKVGTFGDPGSPQAKQVANNGSTAYIRDGDGNVWVVGGASPFALGGAPSLMSSRNNTSKCISGTALGAQLTVQPCDQNSASQRLMWYYDGTIRIRPTSTTEYCIGSSGAANVNANAVLKVCSPATDSTQVWTYNSVPTNPSDAADQNIKNATDSNKCITWFDGWWSGGDLKLYYYDCNQNGSNGQNSIFVFNGLPTPRKMPLPPNTQVTSLAGGDAVMFFLTTNTSTGARQVWGTGVNDRGILGNGKNNRYNPGLIKYGGNDPKFDTIVDATIATMGQINYGTSAGPSNYNAGFVTLADGSVYGTGPNVYGQLGNGVAYSPTPADVLTPTRMLLPSGVKAAPNGGVRTADGTTIVITTSGAVYTVGNNNTGQLGDGTTTNSSTPAARPYYKVPTSTTY